MGKYSHVKTGESVTFSNGATAVKLASGRFKIKSGPTNPPTRRKSARRSRSRSRSPKRSASPRRRRLSSRRRLARRSRSRRRSASRSRRH